MKIALLLLATVAVVLAVPVVFTHVPKCGGTTVHAQLRQQAGDKPYHQALPRTVTPAGHWLHAGSGDKWVHVPYRDLSEQVREAAMFVTVLRDPIERVRSAYRFSRFKAISDITPILQRHTLDHLVRNWRRFPVLAMQIWQPQIVMFFSDDPLPQRRWLQRHGMDKPPPRDALCLAECKSSDYQCVPSNHARWVGEQCCPCDAERLVVWIRSTAPAGEMTTEEVDDLALLLQQNEAGMLQSLRGRTKLEKMEQHLIYSRGRARSAIETLTRKYSVIGTLEQLDKSYDALANAIPWFSVKDVVADMHNNPSPPRDESDWLSPESKEILRKMLRDDIAIYAECTRKK